MPSFFRSKDKRTRHVISQSESSRACLQFFLRNASISSERKHYLILSAPASLKKALKFSVKSRNRCHITGRAGSVFRYFRLSRILLKQLASRGFLTGVRKSS